MIRIAVLLIGVYILSASVSHAQITKEDYNRAVNFKEQLDNKVLHGYFEVNWIGKTGNFWYQVLTEEGEKYYFVFPDKKEKKEAFSLVELTGALSEQLNKQVAASKTSVSNIEFSDDLKTLSFVSNGFHWECQLKGYKLIKGKAYKERTRRPWSMARRDELGNSPVESPDGKSVAYIEDYNLWVKNKTTGETQKFTYDGGFGSYYSSYVQWSPDSKKLMACKYVPTEKHFITYIESSPDGQLQPKYENIEYYKPGDALPQLYPFVFNVETNEIIARCEELIPNQYRLNNFSWRDDSRAFIFEYNKRGHQIYRVIELDAVSGEAKILLNETAETFIDYSSKRYRYDVNDGKEIIWASERDGWNHLYRFDEDGNLINQITKGEWVIRNVVAVDEENKTILFGAGEKEPGDPYHLHYYRINFDGTGLVHLTPGDGNHKVSFSPDKSCFVDSWSRVDLPPLTVLRDAKTGEKLMDLESANIDAMLAEGWKAPEVFVAKGRDGETDIWGHIIRPSHFDPAKKYPVIEYIYAGPHSNHVYKDFTPYFNRCRQTLAELGFIVVSIDGMGTSNRSKAFHDVCWKNLKDAGFPDRILWMQAAAKKYPHMDISKVGIYGKSAGGQNSTGAVLFYPEFYKVAASVCGCHDNRMDKIWWNEQWMGWPIGPEYGECSNVDNAWRLQGDLFLIVGEMDKNVDPASTYQVADALIKANKDFDLLTLPGLGHEWGGQYGERRICNFFVEKIMNATPPEMNSQHWDKPLMKNAIDR